MPDVQPVPAPETPALYTMQGFAMRFWSAVYPTPPDVRIGGEGEKLVWRLLAAAPVGLASAVAEALGLRADVVQHGPLGSASRAGVSRVVNAPFGDARIERQAYSGAFLAPPPDSDLADWMRIARESVVDGAPVVMLTTLDALRAADSGELVRYLSGLNLYQLPAVAQYRDMELPEEQVLLVGSYDPNAPPLHHGARALEQAREQHERLPIFGRYRERWLEGYSENTYPFGSHHRHGLGNGPGRLVALMGKRRERPLFAGPVIAGERAVRLGGERGLFANPARRAALATPAERRIPTLEEAREAHLAQLCVVSPAAQRVRHDGRELLVLFHTARQITREGEMERNAEAEVIGAEIVESESLETIVVALDLENGELIEIDAAELRELQIQLAPQLLASIEEKIEPVITPETAVQVWDEFNAKRPAGRAGQELGRLPWGRQAQTAAAGALALERNGAWLLIGQQGVGKTTIGGITAYLTGYGRTVVICPPQVIVEWERQLAELLPGVRCLTVRRPAELAAVPPPPANAQQFIFIPDSILGLERRVPQAHGRQPLVTGVNTRGRGMRLRAMRVGDDEERREERELAERELVCPSCGLVQQRDRNGRERPIRYAEYMDKARKNRSWRRCSGCEEPLWQYTSNGQTKRTPICTECGWHQLTRAGHPLSERATRRGKCAACGAGRAAPGAIEWKLVDYRAWSLSAAWKRQRFEADLLICDEVHRFKAADSLRGIEAGRLMQLAPRVALLTATLTNGTASSLYYLLLRLTPELREKFPDVTGFTRRFGVRQQRYRVRRVANDEHEQLVRRNYRVSELAGLHPALLGELLHCSSFIEQSDVIEYPIELTEYLEVSHLPENASRLIDPHEDPAAWGEWMTGPFAVAEALAAERGKATEILKWEMVRRLANGEIDWADLPAQMEETLGGVFVRSPSARLRYEEVVTGLPDDAWGRRTGAAHQVARNLPDTWHWRGEAIGGTTGTPYLALPPAADGQSPKERRLVEICRAEAAVGRRCLVFANGMDVRDIGGRLEQVLREAGLRAVVLRPRSGGGADRRKLWIDEQLARGLDVMIAHPKTVGIGFNLQEFVTMISFQVNESNYELRQAMMRSLRVDQREPVKHIYMATLGTRQETDLIMQMSRSVAAIPIEGRVIGPERLARQLGVVAMAAQERALAFADEQRGIDLPDVTARLLTEARDLIPGVALRRAYVAPDPESAPQPNSDSGALPRRVLPPPWLEANDLGILKEHATSETTGSQMALFNNAFGLAEEPADEAEQSVSEEWCAAA